MAAQKQPTSVIVALRRSLGFLDRPSKKKWAALIPLMVVVAVMEAAGAALVFTLIRVMDDPSQISTNRVASAVYQLLSESQTDNFIIIFGFVVAAFYLVKNSLLILQVYVLNRFAAEGINRLASELLRGYLQAPYSFYFRRNSAKLIRNVSSSADAAFKAGPVLAVHVITEVMIVAGILIVLFLIAPAITLAVGILMCGFLTVLLLATQRKFKRWGEQSHVLHGLLFTNLQQSLAGIKELKVLGREKYFHAQFSDIRSTLSQVHWQHGTLEAAPRLLIETVFVCGIVAVIIYFTGEQTNDQVVPLLGLLAYSAFRILPSVHRMTTYYNRLRFGVAAIDEIYDDWLLLKDKGPLDGSSPATKTELNDQLRIERLSYAYESGHDVLEDIDLTITKGESIGIVGPTGAGKSTLIDLILGLLEPTSGTIKVDGTDIQENPAAWQQNIGYVPQNHYLIDDTLRRNIALGLEDSDIQEDQINKSVEHAQLTSLVASLADGLDTKVGELGIRLSGGEKQRVAIARALYHEPEILVFDEATSALDQKSEAELTEAIEALHGEKTMIIIAHRLSTVRRTNRIVFIKNGRLVDSGPFDELLERNADFAALAGIA